MHFSIAILTLVFLSQAIFAENDIQVSDFQTESDIVDMLSIIEEYNAMIDDIIVDAPGDVAYELDGDRVMIRPMRYREGVLEDIGDGTEGLLSGIGKGVHDFLGPIGDNLRYHRGRGGFVGSVEEGTEHLIRNVGKGTDRFLKDIEKGAHRIGHDLGEDTEYSLVKEA